MLTPYACCLPQTDSVVQSTESADLGETWGTVQTTIHDSGVKISSPPLQDGADAWLLPVHRMPQVGTAAALQYQVRTRMGILIPCGRLWHAWGGDLLVARPYSSREAIALWQDQYLHQNST